MIYAVEVLIIIFCIPVFGLCMDFILTFLLRLLSGILGGRFAGFIVNRLMFPGVIQHESAHALLAVLTGAKVNKIVFFHPEGTTLGYVEYVPRGGLIRQSIQHCLIAIAPMLFGCISIVLSLIFQPWNYDIIYTCIWFYYIFSVVFHMNMSSVDVKNYMRGSIVLGIVFYIVFLVLKINFLGSLF